MRLSAERGIGANEVEVLFAADSYEKQREFFYIWKFNVLYIISKSLARQVSYNGTFLQLYANKLRLYDFLNM